jgi:hypothetical protein
MTTGTTPPVFDKLSQNDRPTQGLFFVQHDAATASRDRMMVGVASLIGDKGLVVTCAHVVMMLGCRPGDVLWLGHFESKAAVSARVLEQGWCGPDWAHVNMERPWWDPSSCTPKELDRDLAFLELNIDSATWSESGAPSAAACDTLRRSARVLPFGAPGYETGSGVALKAWCAYWTNRSSGLGTDGADAATASARFDTVDPGLYDALQIKSDELAPGFSGSPLWDEDRRLAVGLVRRGIKAIMPGRVLATDARALRRHPSVRLSVDGVAQRLLSANSALILGPESLRHTFLVGAGPQSWIEPNVRPVVSSRSPTEKPQSESRDDEPALRAIDRVLSRRSALMIMGEAGSGKSRLLLEMARRLGERAGPSPVMPLLLTAASLTNGLRGLTERIESAVQSVSSPFCGDRRLSDVLRLNDVRVALLIDGLDEIARGHRVGLLRDVIEAVQVGTGLELANIIIACRPIDEVQSDNILEILDAIEIRPFTLGQTKELVNNEFDDATQKQAFEEALQRHRLFAEGGNPLQLSLAASVFRRTRSLPERSTDLIESFVDAEIDRMRSERVAAKQPPRRKVSLDCGAAQADREIVDCIGLASLQSDGAVKLDELCARIRALFRTSEAPAWSADRQHLDTFVRRDLVERFGVLSIGDGAIKWLHHSIAEYCAARAIITHGAREQELVDWALRQAWDTARHGFVMHFLSLMERHRLSKPFEMAVRIILRKGVAKPRALLIPLRLLAEGVTLTDDVTSQVITEFVRALLADQFRASCAEILSFQVSDLPDAERLCRDPRLRPLIVGAIETRLRVRQQRPSAGRHRLRGRASEAPSDTVMLTTHEQTVLEKLGLRDEINLAVKTPQALPSFLASQHRFGFPTSVPRETTRVDSRSVAYVGRVRDNQMQEVVALQAGEFASSLVALDRQLPDDTPIENVVGLHLEYILESAQGETPRAPAAQPLDESVRGGQGK